MYIYYLTHEYYDHGRDCDIVTEIGVYSSRKKAEETRRQLEEYPYFKKHTGKFSVARYLVNKPEWTEGFTAYDD